MRRADWYVLMLITALFALFFIACASRDVEIPEDNELPPQIIDVDERGLLVPPREHQIQLRRVDRRTLPAPVSRWIDNSLQLYATGYADTKEFEGTTYIFIARGERMTGGYEVRILDALRREDHIEIRVQFTRPPPDAMVTQAITYPFDVAAIDLTDTPVRFVPEGNDRPSRITRLRGIDSLKDIVASSHTIKVFQPSPGSETGRTASISGVALMPTGSLFYRVLDPAGEVKEIGGIKTASPMDWGYFESHITIPETIQSGSTFQIVLFRSDDATERETDQVPIRLTLRE